MDPWQIQSRDFPARGGCAEQLQFLLRYAILAPSSHNSQPWRFAITEDRIRVYLDLRHWLRVCDADQRELHISVGCALENLLVAAEHFGFAHRVAYFPEPRDATLVAVVQLAPGGSPGARRPPTLFDGLTQRHTSHRPHHDRPLADRDWQLLQACCVEDGIILRLYTDRSTRRAFSSMVERGDLIQFADPAFRRELAGWIGRGVFGTPWLVSKLLQWLVRYVNIGRTQSKRDTALVLSSPVVGVLASITDDRPTQVRVGQVYERLSLAAATQGIWVQPWSQLVEVPELKEELSRLISPPVLIPQQPFRLGFCAPEPRCTLRRPLSEVLRD